MSKIFLLFIVNYLLLYKISHAQYSKRGWPIAPPTSKANQPIAPTPKANAPTPPQNKAPIPPNGYQDKATVYFIPAPPTAPKITVLSPNLIDGVPNLSTSVREGKPISNLQELPASLPLPPPNQMTSRPAFPPPPPCFSGLPDLIDEIPTIVQDRFSRLAETGDETTICECESCAKLIKNLPIFKFDQELLDGFLAGIGI